MIGIVFLLPLLLNAQQTAKPDPLSATFLLHACKTTQAIQVAHTPAPNDEAMHFELVCLDYISGFADAESLRSGACLKERRIGLLIQTYVAYMEKNPQFLNRQRAFGVQAAFQDAYPCPAK